MKQSKVKKMVFIALFGALAGIIQSFEIPIPFVPPFYAIDFSWVIVVLGGFILGPSAAIGIDLIKILIFLVIHSTQTAFVGELAILIMGLAYTLPVTIMYKKSQTRKSVIIGLLISTLSLTIIGALTNYYVLLPAFSAGLQIPIDAIVQMGTAFNPNVNGLWMFVLLMTIPFNLIKAVLNGIIITIIYPKVSSLLKN